ncbi:MAG: alkene reductase, partial [Nitrosomonas sp.]|nr:alkene reductase [Nitrosomonas sp.]
MNTLFTPLKLGTLNVPNRIFMAPLTRCRAGDAHIPNDLMAEYYAQRASAGLIIAEATMATEGNSAFWKEPGIYSSEQIAGWKRVTDAVHATGGRIFLQIWHG